MALPPDGPHWSVDVPVVGGLPIGGAEVEQSLEGRQVYFGDKTSNLPMQH